MKSTVRVNRDDLNTVLEYLEVLNGEKKDYECYEKPRPKNHIWLTIKRLKREMRLNEKKGYHKNRDRRYRHKSGMGKVR